MTPYLVPLTNAQQKFSIALAGVVYNMTLKWNTIGNTWLLDIADQANNPLVSGIALVTGCDLIGQYKHLGIGGSLIAQTDFSVNAPPTYQNLGSNSNLYFVTSP